MSNYDLYNGTPPHVDTETSFDAAVEIEGDVGRLQQLVLSHIKFSFDGVTDDELEVALGLRHQTVSARRRELVLKGLVRDSGRTRKTRSNRKATVWITGSQIEEVDDSIPPPTRAQARKIRADFFAMRRKAMGHKDGFEFKYREAAKVLFLYLEYLSGDRGKKCPECSGVLGRTYDGMWCPKHGIVEVGDGENKH